VYALLHAAINLYCGAVAITYNAGTVAVFVANDPGTITRPMTFLGKST
jgi:hypothetical protein